MHDDDAPDTRDDGPEGSLEQFQARFARSLLDPDAGTPEEEDRDDESGDSPGGGAAGAATDDDSSSESDASDEGDDDAGEDASEEDDDEPGDEDGSEEEQEDEGGEVDPASIPGTTPFTVREGDTEREVTLDELRKGYLRQSKFTKEMQGLAEGRKDLDADRQALSDERERAQQHLQVAIDLIEAQRPYNDEQLAEIKAESPSQWAAAKEELREWQDRIAGLKAKLAETDKGKDPEKAKAGQLKAYQEAVTKSMAELPKVIPEWKDPKVWKQDGKAIEAYLTAQGFTAEQKAALIDPRAIRMVRQSMLYERGRKAKAALPGKKANAAPRVAKPGAKPDPASERGAKRAAQAKQKLKESGRVEDAAAAFLSAGIVK